MTARRIPQGYTEIVEARRENLGIEVYASDSGKSMIAFAGRATNPAFHYSFASQISAQNRLAAWLKQQEDRAAAKAATKAAAKEIPITLVVGDVLVCSWGYEQTNVDYFQVIKMVGKASVEVRPIASETADDEAIGMTGYCVPAVNRFTGEPVTYRVREGNSIKVKSYMTATKKEKMMIAGISLFTPDRWTAYA